MKKIILLILVLPTILYAQQGMIGYLHPVTYHHSSVVDSAQALFKYTVGATPYTDTVSLLPVSGVESQDLYKSNATNLDYVGTYLLLIKIYDAGGVVDSFWSTYINLPDTSSLARSVWDDDVVAEVNRTVTATCDLTGSGPYLCSLYVYNGSGFLTHANVSMKQGANTYYDITSSAGWAVFNLTLGTWYARASAVGNTQDTIPQTFVISADKKDSITMTTFIPTAPAGDLCTVYNWIKDGNNNGVRGVSVEAWIPTDFWPVYYEGQPIQARWKTKTDVNGLWELPVFPNGLLLTASGDSASYWMIKASDESMGQGGIKVTVPDSTTFFAVPDED